MQQTPIVSSRRGDDGATKRETVAAYQLIPSQRRKLFVDSLDQLNKKEKKARNTLGVEIEDIIMSQRHL